MRSGGDRQTCVPYALSQEEVSGDFKRHQKRTRKAHNRGGKRRTKGGQKADKRRTKADKKRKKADNEMKAKRNGRHSQSICTLCNTERRIWPAHRRRERMPGGDGASVSLKTLPHTTISNAKRWRPANVRSVRAIARRSQWRFQTASKTDQESAQPRRKEADKRRTKGGQKADKGGQKEKKGGQRNESKTKW